MKKLKKIPLLAISSLYLLFVGFISPFLLFKNTANAATVAEEYTIWRSYRVVIDCLEDGSGGPNDINITDDVLNSPQKVADEIFHKQRATDGWGSNGFDVPPGDYYLQNVIDLNSNKMKCTVLEDIEPVLEALNFSSVTAFGEAIVRNVPETSSGSRVYTREAIENALRDRIRDLGARPGLDRQLDFQYWYANEMFKTYCNGSFADNREGDGEKISGEFYEVDINDGSYEPAKKFANFNITGRDDSDNTIEGLDGYMTAVFDSRSPGCVEIAGWHTKERAEAYSNRVKANLDSEDAETDTTGGVDAAVSCTEQFGISFGWVVCQMLEAIGSTVEKVFQFVDGLLNIDGQIINSNDQLRTVWSYFRAIATFLLIIVGLVMIISQAVGGPR